MDALNYDDSISIRDAINDTMDDMMKVNFIQEWNLILKKMQEYFTIVMLSPRDLILLKVQH